MVEDHIVKPKNAYKRAGTNPDALELLTAREKLEGFELRYTELLEKKIARMEAEKLAYEVRDFIFCITLKYCSTTEAGKRVRKEAI